jgi:hypothetical protein
MSDLSLQSGPKRTFLGHGSSRDSGLLMNDTVLVGMRDPDKLLHDGILVERNRQRSPLGRTDQCFDGISPIGTEDARCRC